jgi:predicted metal-dependent phosphoesterase TrpH
MGRLLTQAIQIGLEDMAITDHHSVKGYLQGKQWLAQQNTNLRLWIGTEITSYIDDVDIHILGFDFDHEAISLAPYLRGKEADRDFTPASKVIDAIHQAGGLAVLAHPSRKFIMLTATPTLGCQLLVKLKPTKKWPIDMAC